MLQQSLMDDFSLTVSACKISDCLRRLNYEIHFLFQVSPEQAVSHHTEITAGYNEDDTQFPCRDSFQSLAIQFSYLSIWASQIQYPGSDLYIFSWFGCLHFWICHKTCQHWLPAMSSWSLVDAKHEWILLWTLLEGICFISFPKYTL